MKLTDAGAIILDSAYRIDAIIAETNSKIAAMKSMERGVVRVASLPSINATILSKALGELHRAIPELDVQLIDRHGERPIDLLNGDECELVIGYTYGKHDGNEATGVKKIPLIEDPLYLIIPQDYRVTSTQKPINLAELTNASWIVGCAQCRHLLTEVMNDSGFSPNIEFTATDYVAVQTMVSEGFGIAIQSGLMLANVRLQFVDVQPLPANTHRAISVYVKRSSLSTPGIPETIRALVSACENFTATGLWHSSIPNSVRGGSLAPVGYSGLEFDRRQKADGE